MINKETWDCLKGTFVETPIEMINFLNELDNLCKKYDLSISHEDSHGAFIIERYDKNNISWIQDAMKRYETKEEKYLKNLF